MESDKVFQSALREFFMAKGYSMEKVECEEDECNLFTIEALPEIIKEESKVVKIPKK